MNAQQKPPELAGSRGGSDLQKTARTFYRTLPRKARAPRHADAKPTGNAHRLGVPHG